MAQLEHQRRRAVARIALKVLAWAIGYVLIIQLGIVLVFLFAGR